MEYGTGCLVCGDAVIYTEITVTLTCYYCGVRKDTNASCRSGHFVCDTCHNAGANQLIELYCSNTDGDSPAALAMALMKNPAVKMHGPEHHFLVPAVLIAAYCNGNHAVNMDARENVREARKRAEEVKGGFCGFQGACGAAIGAGIFMSIVSGATPLSDRERMLSNLITAECLRAIAEKGGPRCCKRESFTAIITSVEFVRRELGVSLPVDPIPPCVFTAMNRECIRGRCSFYGAARGVEQQGSILDSPEFIRGGDKP
jgi:hypothetical protein